MDEVDDLVHSSFSNRQGRLIKSNGNEITHLKQSTVARVLASKFWRWHKELARMGLLNTRFCGREDMQSYERDLTPAGMNFCEINGRTKNDSKVKS